MGKTVLINSLNRVSGTHSNFLYEITEIGSNEYDRVVCTKALIHKSYYLVQTGKNDSFTLTEGIQTATVTLDAGNYNINNLKTILATKLNTASPNGYTYSITYPSTSQVDTGKLTYSVTGNGGTQPVFTFSSVSPYEILGFNSETENNFSGSSLTSTNVVNLQKEDSLIMNCDMIVGGVLFNVFSSQDSNYSSIIYNVIDVQRESKSIINKGTGIYHFSLTDENGNTIDTNGLNIIIELLFFNDESEINIKTLRMIQGYIKYNLLDNDKIISE
jgi:hypothetical protein